MTLPRRSQRLQAKPQDQSCQHLRPEHKRKRKHGDDIIHRPPSEPPLKRLRLSEKNLRKLREAQGRDTSQQTMGKTRKTPSSSRTSTVTTTDKLFASRLAENRVIYELFDTEPPNDAKELMAELLKEQEVPKWAAGEWQRMKNTKRQGAQNELSLESAIIESMFWQHLHDCPYDYNRFRNQQWTEVENEITAGISDPKPDVTEAYLWSAYPAGTREDFAELVISQYSYAMPTFAMESKGSSADPDEAVRQAAYDGAVMTHAAVALDGHLGQTELQFQTTKAITVTLSTSDISVYANHAVKEKTGSRCVFYHQYRLLRIEYNASEEEWNRAYVVIYNAQRIALCFANARLSDLKNYFDEKEKKLEKLKLEQARLQQQAQLKTKVARDLHSAQQVPKKSISGTKAASQGIANQTPNGLNTKRTKAKKQDQPKVLEQDT